MFAAGPPSRLLVPTRYAVERSAAHKAIQQFNLGVSAAAVVILLLDSAWKLEYQRPGVTGKWKGF
jgi:hypothetical protein